MPIDFPCSKCGRTLRTPENAAGRQAQCPECQAMTTVPGLAPGPVGPASNPFSAASHSSPFGPADAEPGSASINPYQSPSQLGMADLPLGMFGESKMPPGALLEFARSRTIGPAIALVILGILDLLLWGVNLVALLVNPAQHAPPARIAGALIACLACTLIGVLVIFGAIQMKNLKSYGLSMTAAILAVTPCFWPCCLLSIPFGIWAIVVLNDPLVKDAFQG